MMNPRKSFIERSTLVANVAAQKTATGSMIAMSASMMTMLVGIFLMESILSPGPTIPHPHQQSLHSTTRAGREQMINPAQQIATLFVYPKDADRLAHTLEADVIRHGGWTMTNNNDRNLEFAVSEQYLDRIQPLIESPTVRQVDPGYTEWVADVFPNPDRELRRVTPNTTLYVNLKSPLAANPATLPMIAVTGSIIGGSILTLLCCAVVHQCTKQQNRSG